MKKKYSIKKAISDRVCFALFFILFSTSVYSQSSFIKNEGQWDSAIKYKSSFRGGNLYLEDGVLNFNFQDTEELDKYVYNHHKKQFYDDSREIIIHGHCLKTKFLNANNDLITEEEDQIIEYFNYYLGNNPKKWASKVSAFNTVVYKNLYNNIDLKVKVKDAVYKYDLIVKPNTTVSQIKIEYLGAENISLKNGNLIIKTSVNDIEEQSPIAYQEIDGKMEPIKCVFVLENGIISFDFPNGYNVSKELIIDPYIVFSRISGSSADNFGYTATYDSEENAYGAGSVYNNGFITTPGAYDNLFNGALTDIGIVKYSSDGIQRIYSTYLGGNRTDLPHSIVVNSRDELFLLGTTGSANFPIDTFLTTYDQTFNGGSSLSGANFNNGINVNYPQGSDMIVTRFSEDGTDLLASTYLGGSGNDGLNYSNFLTYNYADEFRGEILMDKNDNCFIVSCTNSADFPIKIPSSAFQADLAGGFDAIVVKMDENLTDIIWSTYLGGNSDDAAYSLDFDQNENIVLTGGTRSIDFPMVNAYQSVYGGANADGFITRLHSSGTGLLSSTYYGTADYDQIYFVELNEDDEIHIFGQTKADTGQLVHNALYYKPKGGQMLAKFDPTLDSLIWATRFGDESGIPDISPTAFLVDLCNRIFLSGWGWASGGYLSGTAGLEVTVDAIDNTTDNEDFYFMVLEDDASSLIYGSFFGGTQSREHVDGGTSRFDKKGIIYQAICAGCGGNQDFPTVPSSNNWPNGSTNCNLGVVKYAFSPPSIIADFSYNNNDCAPTNIHFENQSQTASNDTTNVDFIWTVNGQVFTTYHLDYNFTSGGLYEVSLIALEPQSCNFEDTATKFITILGNTITNLEDRGVCNGNLVQIGITPLSNNSVSYTWSPNYFLSDTTIANPYANPPIDTIYTLIVSNGFCVDTFVQKVVTNSINIEIEPFDSVCLESDIIIKTTKIDGALYQWNPDELIVDGQSTNVATVYAENSNQALHLEVTSLEGCTDEIFFNLMTIDDLPDLNVFADPDTIESSASSNLLAESSDAIWYKWRENDYFDNLTVNNPKAVYILETTTFKVEVHNGICPKKDSVTVYVEIPDCLEGKFYVPNAFSPNNDGYNDVFKVRTTLIKIQDFYFAVYDRWGNLVFETNNKTKGWDGTFNGKELTPNVYGWYTEGICPNGEEYFVKGNVTLLK